VADNMLRRLLDHDIMPLPVIMYNPAWAASPSVPGRWRHCGPLSDEGRSGLAGLIAALAERYDGDGRADAPGSPVVILWEVYNEPDFDPGRAGEEGGHGGCWGGDADSDRVPDPHEYGELLRAVYPPLRSAASHAQLVFGGVALERTYNGPYNYQGVNTPFNDHFVDQALGHLASTYGTAAPFPYFDALAFHNYHDFRDVWDGAQPYDQEIIGKARYVRNSKLKGNSYQVQVPLIATEMGLLSGPSEACTSRSEALQALYVAQSYIRSLAADIRLAIWFNLTDLPALGEYYRWGLLHEGGSRKPAFQAYSVLSVQLGDEPVYDAQLPASATGSSNIEAHRLLVRGQPKVVAWTDTGHRLGRRIPCNGQEVSPVVSSMLFGPQHFRGAWTGRLMVVEHLGSAHELTGDTIRITLDQAPRYIFPSR
jgi:hypothetical protein